MINVNRMRLFFKSCLLFFSKRGEVRLKPQPINKEGFSVIDNVLYYISGKTKIKIKKHFSETNVTAIDLVESAIKYESRAKSAG